MKRIVIDARESGTTTGRYVDKLIEHLHSLKPAHEIIILVKNHRLEYIKQIAPKFEVIGSNFKEFTLAEQFGLMRQLNSLAADLVHFSMTQQPIFYKGKAITTVHDLTTARYNNPSKNWLKFKFKQLVYKWVIKRVARKSVTLITPSDWVKYDVAQYAKIEPQKITVTYEAADEIAETPMPVKMLAGEKFIMYVGRPQPHKNLKRLVRAFSQVQLTHSSLKLALVGKLDTNFEMLRKYIHRHEITGVIFTDFVTEGQLRWLYEHASAYVFPSLSEGFGLPGLEAMVHDLPVISSRATCLPEIYKGAAIYFDPLDTQDIADKVKKILEDKELAAKLRHDGPRLAAHYSWRKTAEQTLAVYEQVLERC